MNLLFFFQTKRRMPWIVVALLACLYLPFDRTLAADALDLLVAQLQSKSVLDRANAATRLGLFKDQRAVTALIAALDDTDRYVRSKAATALGQIGSAAAVTPLRHLSGDTDEGVRTAAAAAIKLITTNPDNKILP